MTNEERDIITNFIARVGGAAAVQPTQSGASVPATTTPALPPIDREADTLIGDLFNRYPETRYRITQLAFVQEHALVEAQARLKRLEWELQQTQQATTQQRQQQGGGFFSGLFGGRSQAAQAPQQQGGPWGQGATPGYEQAYPPQYPPGYQAGMFQQSGSGFLGSALTTAAGVAGGVLAADAIRDLFSPHQGSGWSGGGPGSPWGTAPPADEGYVDQGSWTTPDAGAPPDRSYVNSGTWDQSGADQSGTDQGGSGSWSDPSNDPSGSGWDSGGADTGGTDPGDEGSDSDSLT